MSDRATGVGRRIAAATREGGAGGASLLLAGLAVIVWLAPAGVAEALQFDRARIASGELWRLVTCHWTHWDADHLAWDVATFVALGVACERRGRVCFLSLMLL